MQQLIFFLLLHHFSFSGDVSLLVLPLRGASVIQTQDTPDQTISAKSIRIFSMGKWTKIAESWNLQESCRKVSWFQNQRVPNCPRLGCFIIQDGRQAPYCIDPYVRISYGRAGKLLKANFFLIKLHWGTKNAKLGESIFFCTHNPFLGAPEPPKYSKN